MPDPREKEYTTFFAHARLSDAALSDISREEGDQQVKTKMALAYMIGSTSVAVAIQDGLKADDFESFEEMKGFLDVMLEKFQECVVLLDSEITVTEDQ